MPICHYIFYLILALIQYVLFIIIFWDFSSILKCYHIFTVVFGVLLEII